MLPSHLVVTYPFSFLKVLHTGTQDDRISLKYPFYSDDFKDMQCKATPSLSNLSESSAGFQENLIECILRETLDSQVGPFPCVF